MADVARDVLVVIGAGGMGQAASRRIGSGRQVVLADFNAENLETATARPRGEGYEVIAQPVDVSSPDSVTALAQRSGELGPVTRIVYTAGLSPVQAPVRAILAVDLLGVALVAKEFGKVVAASGAGVFIASMAAQLASHEITAAEAAELRTTPAAQLLSLQVAAEKNFESAGAAYGFCKRANQLRIEAASTVWGARGARINTISPGVIATPMGQAELGSEHATHMRAMVDASATRRLGTPEDIAAAVDFLLSPAASFSSGTDLLVTAGSSRPSAPPGRAGSPGQTGQPAR